MNKHFAVITAVLLITLFTVGTAFSYSVGSEYEDAKITASDSGGYDYFGKSVSISGDVAIAGSYKDDDNGTNAGAAYIYRFDGDQWVEEAKLLASDGSNNDEFGTRVSIDGDIAIVGAPKNGYHAGTAYVYRFNGTQWVEQAILQGSSKNTYGGFGFSVCVEGDKVIVGEYGFSTFAGCAFVFRFNGKSWVEESKLVASDGLSVDELGWSVSISGDTAIVGAPYSDGDGNWSGSAYLFRFNGNDWVEESKLTASDASSDDKFGNSVSISGDNVFVGSPYADNSDGMNSGAVYAYRYDGGSWVEQSKLFTSDGTADDSFGYHVSLSGINAVVGAYTDDDNGTDSGSVQMYHFDGDSWIEGSKLLASDGTSENFFGYSVCISDTNVIVGSPQDSNNYGAAYIYNLDQETGGCDGDINGDSVVNVADLLVVIADWGSSTGDATDINQDGVVDVLDLLLLVAAWGPCE
jgi:hypothetical protein